MEQGRWPRARGRGGGTRDSRGNNPNSGAFRDEGRHKFVNHEKSTESPDFSAVGNKEPVYGKAPPEAFTTGVIILQVGQAMSEFSIHAGILRHHSTFFDFLLQPGTEASRSRVIKLPHHRPEIVQTFLYFAYCTVICKPKDLAPESEVDDRPAAVSRWHEQLIHCWSLGHQLCMPFFQDAALDTLHKSVMGEQVSPIHHHRLIYDASRAETKLKSYLTDISVETLSFEDLRRFVFTLDASPQLHENLMAKYAELAGRRYYADGATANASREQLSAWNGQNAFDLCRYHAHASRVRCKWQNARPGTPADAKNDPGWD